MQQESLPTLTTAHFRKLRGALVRRATCPEASREGPRQGHPAQDGSAWLSPEDVWAALREDPPSAAQHPDLFSFSDPRAKAAHQAIEDLGTIIRAHQGTVNPGRIPKTTPSAVSARQGGEGWALLALIGECKRAARAAREARLRADEDPLPWAEKTYGERVILHLWRRMAVRAAAAEHNLSSPPRTQKVPDEAHDRLLGALQWRLARPPGQKIGAAAIRLALRVRLGRRPDMREAQKELPKMVESWKQCCRLSREVRSDEVSSDEDRSDEVHFDPESEPQDTCADRGSNKPPEKTPQAESEKDVDASRVGHDSPALQGGPSVSLSPVRTSPTTDSDLEVFQVLRLIRGRMNLGSVTLTWDRAAKSLDALLRRSAGSLVRRSPKWDKAVSDALEIKAE